MMDLKQIDVAAWALLNDGACNTKAGFHFLTFCTVDSALQPQARTVVLRQVGTGERSLSFYTDVRSPKWQEMAINPRVTVLGYCNHNRLQLRLRGWVEQYDQKSTIGLKVWRNLSSRARCIYTNRAPGDDLISRENEKQNVSCSLNSKMGRENFGVIVMRVNTLEWYQLHADNNQRALMNYTSSGMLLSSQWIVP